MSSPCSATHELLRMSCHGAAPAPAPSSGHLGTATRPAALRVLLVGGPNAGKSTLFNALTGARQHTTNAPGTTVELATGTWRTGSVALDPAADSTIERAVVDLPGSYSLLARSSDERVTADALRELAQSSGELAGQPGVVVVVLDATTLARSLYLLAQVAETGLPLIVALTMLDLAATATDSPTAAKESGTLAAALEASLGVPVVPVDARSRATGGLRDLARAVDDVAAHPRLVTGIAAQAPSCGCVTAAVREGSLPDIALDLAHAETLFTWVEQVVEQVTTRCALESDVTRPGTSDGLLHRRTFSDRVDAVLLNPWAGIPVFLAVVWLLFELTTRFAAPLQGLIGQVVHGPLASGITWLLGLLGLATPGCRGCWSTVFS